MLSQGFRCSLKAGGSDAASHIFILFIFCERPEASPPQIEQVQILSVKSSSFFLLYVLKEMLCFYLISYFFWSTDRTDNTSWETI